MGGIVDEGVVISKVGEEASHGESCTGAHQAKNENTGPAKDLGSKDTDDQIDQIENTAVEKVPPPSIRKKCCQ